MSDPIITLTARTAALVALLEDASAALRRLPIANMPQWYAEAPAACSAAQEAITAALTENTALRAQIQRDGALLRDLAQLSIGQTPPSVLLATIKESAQEALAARRHLIGEEVP